MFRIVLLVLFCMLQAGLPVYAADDDVPGQLRARIAKLLPDESDFRISESPIQGLYQVDFANSFIYISADGQYVMRGDIIVIDTDVNLTEVKRSAVRFTNVEAIGEENMIIYPAKDKRYSITVFTDIDCGYCRKLHNEIDEFTSQGIEVRYLFNPLAGPGSASYNKAVSVWCASDRREALTTAKSGKAIEQRTCDNPILQHMKVARTVGARSTPTIMLEDGAINPGYVPAAKLRRILDVRSKVATN